MKIGLVQPTFTAAAYNNAFYVFYNKYYYAHNTPVVCWSCVQSLYAVVPDMSTWTQNAAIAPVLNLLPTVQSLRPNDTVELLTDEDIDAGAAQFHDVLFLFHHEYLTQQEYTNIQNFVNSGGRLVCMDGNVFFAEVMYAEPGTTTIDPNHIRLVSGHFWEYPPPGKPLNYAQQTPNVGERWASNTLSWFGSNSDAGPTIYKYGYLNLTLYNNPFNYPAGTSGAENQYIPANEVNNVNILLDFQAVYTNISGYNNAKVAVYEKTYGSGKILNYGIFTDRIQSNTAFQQYFATSLNSFLGP